MIFSIGDHIQQIIAETKTMTRRPTDRYKVGNLYAIQPGRGKKGIPDGKIYIFQKIREWKPDLSSFPKGAIFARRWRERIAGYPIQERAAKAEGGYSSEEFEALYEKMYPGWTERWAYDISFVSKEDLEEIEKLKGSEVKQT